jgi:hypothetical protein
LRINSSMTEPCCLVYLDASGIFVSGRLRHPRKRLHPIAKKNVSSRTRQKKRPQRGGAAEAVFGAEYAGGGPAWH